MSRPTYTRVMLVLGSDGRSSAYRDPAPPSDILPEIKPSSSGNDRGPYRVYELGGFSIDVAHQLFPCQPKS